MAIGFVDVYNVHDPIAREMTMTPLGWTGVREEEVRMVEGTFEDTKSRVLRGPGTSEEFEVNVRLSPLFLSLCWN